MSNCPRCKRLMNKVIETISGDKLKIEKTYLCTNEECKFNVLKITNLNFEIRL